jgi:hypothetical protein
VDAVGDREDIRRVIEQAYIEGIHLEQDGEKVHSGFHPAFRMLVRKGEEIDTIDPAAFLAMVKARRENDPAVFEPELTYDIPLIDVAQTTAVARIELFRGGVHLWTDYQLLYRFDDGWKIVSKTYHAHG